MQMRNPPQEKLIELVSKYGPQVYKTADQCRQLLENECGDYNREVFVLTTAVDQEVPAKLLAYRPEQELVYKVIDKLKRELISNCALLPEAAKWAVESWGQALQVISKAELKTEEQIINFPCKNLELVIRNKIKKYIEPLTVADVQQITSLTPKSLTITSLQGLEYLINLEKLSLCLTNLHELSTIAGLSNLRKLNLRGNQITNISPLANLKQLTVLQLQGNQISKITPLAKLTKLKTLDLRGNKISEVAPLAKLTNLTELYLDSNQISDLTPLADLTSLRYLFITENPLEENQAANVEVVNQLKENGVYLQS